jgi:hypothetical protein
VLKLPQPGQKCCAIVSRQIYVDASQLQVLQLHGRWQNCWVNWEVVGPVAGQRNRKVLKGCELREAWYVAGADAAVKPTDS